MNGEYQLRYGRHVMNTEILMRKSLRKHSLGRPRTRCGDNTREKSCEAWMRIV